ncbi:MAG TPA: helicase HerA-like domain-containing protein [Salinimicrobium sp.]|nr:helicase HerA-like domain-containing protein [Salinimicrobium sp.]
MDNNNNFVEHINKGYSFKGDNIFLGAAMLNGKPIADARVKIPLSTLNRHGLIAGATGTGKTKTLQILAENLSQNGIPVLMMDIKGDLSGIAKAAAANEKLDARHKLIDFPFVPKASPVELMSLSEQPGVRLKATVSEFGPLLLSKIMELSDAQSGVLSIIFKYCDDKHLPLLDLKDLKKILLFATEDGKEEFEKSYGRISKSSTGAILREIVALEQQGADIFFGEPSFEVQDLVRKTSDGAGYVNIVRLDDLQDKPGLFSTFMLSILAEIYTVFPEKGDSEKPELVIFIDEAHLIFEKASGALMDQLESIIKLIRSKGIGIFFITQNPTDVPQEILSQLGLKIQHSLRAFTAKDRKAIKLAAENYPISEFYDTKTVLTSMGIGEALVSALDEKGRPTPLAATMLRAPQSRMDILTPAEISEINTKSALAEKYNRKIDRESAYEILTEKIQRADEEEAKEKAKEEREKVQGNSRTSRSSSRKQSAVIKVLTSATFIRGVMSILNKAFK